MKATRKEDLIQAFYDAKTIPALTKANDEWLAFYNAASEEDKEHMGNAMVKYSEWLLAKSKESREEFKQLLAEIEAMKLAESQH
ncbi:hypothetical protein SAMN04487996_104336 [Dyadobacter soli]|uniref:Uncharacterized protein n=1 Tax=Dyadobacter soli TaxID=659014 RepID=A0A1G7BX19_9BACT|nr:hypothetical protein [Dyadobacter soli]SDE31654.1 hypothetical protein SAMN04487996_104336 [Dyadobacter soli]